MSKQVDQEASLPQTGPETGKKNKLPEIRESEIDLKYRMNSHLAVNYPPKPTKAALEWD